MIAYKQPISRGAIASIRAVNVDSVVRTLLGRGLITEAFTDSETGAIHYGTTDAAAQPARHQLARRAAAHLAAARPTARKDSMTSAERTRPRPTRPRACGCRKCWPPPASPPAASERDHRRGGRVARQRRVVVTELGRRVTRRPTWSSSTASPCSSTPRALRHAQQAASAWSARCTTSTAAPTCRGSSQASRNACSTSAGWMPQTSGLLILTNDGELAHVLAHPSFGVMKTYIAKVRRARHRRRPSRS